MRVIAGSRKGHRLKSPTTGTRPMADRMKEALFSALGDCSGMRVLDLYAGSGSLGIEALSRGAIGCIFVESSRDAVVKLEQNLESTGLKSQAEIEWNDVSSTLKRPPDERMDLIFVDAPYSTPAAVVREDLETIVTEGWLSDDGKVVVHRPGKESALDPFGLEVAWERDYGQSALYVFGHEEEDGEA